MKTKSTLDVWTVSALDLPDFGTSGEKLKFLLRYAMLAPSTHNTQPWLFHIRGDEVELYADRTRVLHTMDPEDRQLIMSCGGRAVSPAYRDAALCFSGRRSDVPQSG